MFAHRIVHLRDPQYGTQPFVWNLHRPRSRSGARSRLRKRSRHTRMKRDVALHLLHDLMNMSVENGYGAEPLHVSERLPAVFGSPAPILIYRPQWDVGKNDDWSAAGPAFQVLLDPFEFLRS